MPDSRNEQMTGYESGPEVTTENRPVFAVNTWRAVVHGLLDRSRLKDMRPFLLLAAVLLTAAPALADARDDAKKQVEFGIEVAQKGLWREAIYRFERAAQLDPTYAAAHNNLAIGYEHQGELDKASRAYEMALKLDPNNQLIKQNYELFREINDRTTRAQ